MASINKYQVYVHAACGQRPKSVLACPFVFTCPAVGRRGDRRRIRLPRPPACENLRSSVPRRVVSTKRPLRFSSEHDRTKQNSFRIIRNSTNDARPSRAQRIRFNASTNHERNQLALKLRSSYREVWGKALIRKRE